MGGRRAPPLWRAMFAAALTALTLLAAADAAVDGWSLEVVEPRGGGGGGGGGELQLSAGQVLRLRCEGPERARWLYPIAEESEVDEPLSPDVAEGTVEGAPGRWAATLHLANVSYYHTGAYACVRHAHPLDSPDPPKHLVDIYVYVADPEYPWVRAGVVTTWAMQHEEAVLDCRPNNRSLHVKLLDSSEHEVPMGLNEHKGWTARWSPMLGFSLEPINMRDAGIFFCVVDPGGADAVRLMVMLNLLPRSTNLAPPRVHPINALPHAVLGKSMELQCFATVRAHVFFFMEWLEPPNSTAMADGRLNKTPASVHYDASGARIGSTNLTIVNVTESDAGTYTCVVSDHSKKEANTTFLLEVRDANVSFIDVKVDPPESLHQRVGLLRTATWTLDVVTYPTAPTISWFTPSGSQLTAGSASKFPMEKRERGKGLAVTLSVMDVELSDRGTYTLKINTGPQEKTVNLTLTVLAPPLVQVQAPPEPWPLGASRRVTCTALGSPLPTLQWAWHPCPGLLQNCAPDDSRYKVLEAPVTSQSDVKVNSTLELPTNSSGFITCRAANELDDTVNDTVSVQVTDMPGPRTLEAWGPEPGPVVEGDDLRLVCGALRENHTDWPHWRRTELWDEKRFQMTRYNTSALSMRSQLRINPATVADSGTYLCFLDDLEETTVEYKLDVKPQQNVFPRQVNVNNTEWIVNTRDKLTLNCNFDGLPRPTISWYKDGEPLALAVSGEQFRLEDGNKTLVIGFVTEADQSEYRCRATNRVHSEERWVRLQLRNRKGITSGMVALIVVLVVLLLALVPLSLFVYKDWKRRRMLISGLHHFAEGQPDVLNPELPADEQAELLPYDRKWEFPRERLKLGFSSVSAQYTTAGVGVSKGISQA